MTDVLTEVLIDGTNASSYLLNYQVKIQQHNQKNDRATVTVTDTIIGNIDISLGKTISIKRGLVTATENTLFIGKISKVDEGENVGEVVLTVRNPLWELKDKLLIKSWKERNGNRRIFQTGPPDERRS